MANPVIGDLVAATAKAKGAMQSAVVFINGFGQKLKDAIAAALANGATEAELEPLQTLDDELNAEADNVAAAIAANP